VFIYMGACYIAILFECIVQHTGCIRHPETASLKRLGYEDNDS
jgi:hypothetical protein